MNSGEGNEGIMNKSSIVTSLHAILKPFLLRRLKVDVEKDLPPKKEYLLYAPLTQQQKDIYQAIVSRNIRKYLVDKVSGREEEEEEGVKEVVENEGRSKRNLGRIDYKIEENDSKFINDLQDGVAKEEPSGVKDKSATEVGQEWAYKQASKSVLAILDTVLMTSKTRQQHATSKSSHAAQKGQFLIFCLLVRELIEQISSHPFLFDWPSDPKTNELVVNDDLVNASGKMLLLNRLLDALFDKGHKVLIFSQFTTMLDVIVSSTPSPFSPPPHSQFFPVPRSFRRIELTR